MLVTISSDFYLKYLKKPFNYDVLNPIIRINRFEKSQLIATFWNPLIKEGRPIFFPPKYTDGYTIFAIFMHHTERIIFPPLSIYDSKHSSRKIGDYF